MRVWVNSALENALWRVEVVFLDIYPKNGSVQQLDEEDEVIIKLLHQYAEEMEAGKLSAYEI